MAMTLRNRSMAVAAMVLGFDAMFAGTASAHTTLVASNPTKGAKVSSLSEVSLTFNESVKFVKVQVRDGHGGQHQAGKPVVQGGNVTQKLAGNLTPGTDVLHACRDLRALLDERVDPFLVGKLGEHPARDREDLGPPLVGLEPA